MSGDYFLDAQLSEGISFYSPTPQYTIQFHGQDPREVVGRIEIVNGEFRFTGYANESAKIFFEQVLKPMCDEYIRNEIEKKRTETVAPKEI